MVPLDGSELAERAVPVAVELARSAHARLMLAHVHAPLAEPIHVEGLPILDEHLHPLRRLHEQTYLDRASQRLAGGVEVSVVLLEGRPVSDTLVQHAERTGVRLIIMSTHGRSGFERAWLGSVADEILHQSRVPLLLLRPEPGPVRTRLRRILAPIDGSGLADAILEPALGLARLGPDAELILLTVVPPGPSSAATQQAYASLDAVRRRLEGSGVRVRARVQGAASVVPGILEVARQEEADVLAVATHGRSGLLRLASGSVAYQLVRESHTPVLLLRPASATTTVTLAQEPAGSRS